MAKLFQKRQDLQALVLNKTQNLKNQNEKNKIIFQNENKLVPFEDNLRNDHNKEKAYFKALNYENVRKSLKTYENSRKEIRDNNKMNKKLVKDFIYI